MKVVKEYPNGLFNWVDLSTTDQEAAKAFYGGLFGWECEDVPTGMGSVYTMCRIDGYSVAGIGPLPPDLQAQGVPPFWSSYVKHDDVDAIAAKITAAGGTLMMPPMDVMTEGRMVMALDPTGATFGVWQPKDHIGAQIVNAPNALFWNELQTHDVEVAKSFYASVFGWTHETDENGYVALASDGRVQAGMMAIQKEWGEVPPNWSVYFNVADVETAVASVKELGGNLLNGPIVVGEMGRLAVVQDPQGGVFNVMESSRIDAPPGY
ncbi:MAG: VOC family protein [Anaerolineae bacterium]|nr:VOC family protein [Anaerolineae bacterium]